MKKVKCLAAIAMAALGLTAHAAVIMPHLYGDNMIVQRNATLRLTGRATPGAQVQVSTDWLSTPATATVGADSNFLVEVPTTDAGGPFTIIVTDMADPANPKIINNVLCGDVWLASGQSNMEFPMSGWSSPMDSEAYIHSSHHPDIRLLRISKRHSFNYEDDAPTSWEGWVEASPAYMDFSAIGYLYGLKLHESLGVPIGIIDSSWGGTVAEAWTDVNYLDDIPGFEAEVASIRRNNHDKKGIHADFQKRFDDWYRAIDSLDLKFDRAALQSGPQWRHYPVGDYWENTLYSDNFDGVIWAQCVLDLPEEAAGRPIELHLARIDDEDNTFFNGTQVGTTNAHNAMRVYPVDGPLVRAGKNVITVRINDPQGAGGMYGPTADMYALVGDKRYPLTSGWQCAEAFSYAQVPPSPQSSLGNNFPTVLYNGMIYPLRNMPLKGVIWYQGCSNVPRPAQYEPLFQNLIRNWRDLWQQPDLPFYFVQISSFGHPRALNPESLWAQLRNSQAKALCLPYTGMVVTTDLGNPADIHPRNKQDIADRLWRLAMKRTYGATEPIDDEAPTLKSWKVKGSKAILEFSGPVKPTSAAITGFIIGDGGEQFAVANARQTSPTTIEVSSPLVEKPAVVRYNWADYANGNLYAVPTTDAKALPVGGFATDF